MTSPSQIEPQIHLCSFPSSGRTWLRFMMADVLAAQLGEPGSIGLNNLFTLIPNDAPNAERGLGVLRSGLPRQWPVIAATHARDTRGSEGKRVLLLYRDALDVFASKFPVERAKAPGFSVRDYVEHPVGVSAMADWMNAWLPLRDEARTHVVTYARLIADPADALAGALRFCSHNPEPEHIEGAVRRGSIDNLRDIEARDRFRSDGGPRIREGGLGRHRTVFEPDELGVIKSELKRRLSPEAVRGMKSLETDPSWLDDRS